MLLLMLATALAFEGQRVDDVSGGIRELAVDANGRWAAITDLDGQLAVVRDDLLRPVPLSSDGELSAPPRLSAGGASVVVGQGGAVRVLDARTGLPLWQALLPGLRVESVVFAPDGGVLATAVRVDRKGRPKTPLIAGRLGGWPAGSELHRFDAAGLPLASHKLPAHGDVLLTDPDGNALISGAVEDFVFSPRGRVLGSTPSRDRTADWALDHRSVMAARAGLPAPAEDPIPLPYRGLGTVQLFRWPTLQAIASDNLLTEGFSEILFTADDHRLLAAGGSLEVWSVAPLEREGRTGGAWRTVTPGPGDTLWYTHVGSVWKVDQAAGRLAELIGGARCLEGDCESGFGRSVTPQRTYAGDHQNGKPHGQGKASFANGSSYTGSWAAGRYEGAGTLTMPGGREIAGDWLAGRFQGSCDGDCVDGEGRRIWPDMSEYIGPFVDGEPHGFGVWTDGAVQQEGWWAEGQRHGLIVRRSDAGEVRSIFRRGELFATCASGGCDEAGSLDLAGGGHYDGDLLHGLPSGEGVLRDARYVVDGTWQDGLAHGAIAVRWSDGRAMSARADMGKVTEGTVYFPDGRVWSGPVTGLVPHGEGVVTTPEGDSRPMRFENGEAL